MAYNVGGMLAQAGQTIGQQIGAPIREIGTGIGGMLAGRQQKQREQEAAKESQRLLQQYANDPAQLNALGQKYATEGNDALSKVFFEAAKQAQQIYDKQVARTDARVADAKKRRDALIAGREATDEAFGEAMNMRRALVDAKRRSEAADATDKDKKLYELLKTRAITPSEYAKELLKEDKKGSEAKGYKVEDEILINGKKQSVVEFFDAEGNFLNRRVIGEVAPDKGEAEGRDDWSVNEEKAYTQAVADQRAASEDSRKYSSLLLETIDIAGESGQVGGILGMARDFVIADVAGLGDAITVHRSRLNEVRMQNAIALLPRGPASDRDVRLALDASVDPKNLSPEDRVSYIRGMKKIADAEKEYMDGKLRWIEQTGDPLAFGYERKVSLDGIKKQVEAFRTDNSTEVVVLEGELQKVRALASAGNKEQAMELLNYIKSIDSIGYLSLLEDQEAEQQRYDNFIEKNNINFF